MSSVAEQSSTGAPRKKSDIAVDAVRTTAHLAHEARLLKGLAADALEEGRYAARRAARRVERRVEEIADMPAEMAHRIRRQPLKAVAVALGVGLIAGALLNLVVQRSVRRCEDAR